ncbi:hypothetical protein SESBI_50568, partial [Sesbania bispinosa]
MADPGGACIDPKPPDGDGEKATDSISFRDKLIGVEDSGSMKKRVDLPGYNLFGIELEDGNRLKP